MLRGGKHAIAIGLLGATSATLAEDHLLIVGGGPYPQDSQVSIERNVQWIESLTASIPFASHQIYFAGGPAGPPDVVLNATEDPTVQRWLPLARVFGEQASARQILRWNGVRGNLASATSERVTRALEESIAQMQPGDDLLFVYNGHGAMDQSSDTSYNSLRLWGESRLNVRQFAAILDQTPQDATVRYILPQCFSGGFQSALVGEPGNPRLADVRPGRCGFFSVAENVVAEGCTAGVEVGDYRDYSTYFFAALSGKTRTGEPLSRDPDRDENGHVSLSEAHEYSYTEGSSTDVPRATSEYYLELWQPSSSRWHSFLSPADDNPYAWRARRLAENLGLTAESGPTLAAEALTRRLELDREARSARVELARLLDEESGIRREIFDDLRHQWPAADEPGDSPYASFIASQPDAAVDWARRHALYPALLEAQERIEQAELISLEIQRMAAGITRIQRALKLSALREDFQRRASDAERDTYQSLEKCEAWEWPGANGSETDR